MNCVNDYTIKDASLMPNDIVLAERTVKGIIGNRNIFPAVISAEMTLPCIT